MNRTKATAGVIGLSVMVLWWPGATHAGPPKDPPKKCAADAVLVGSVCMDKYEASVWRVPNATTTNATLVKGIKRGKVTAAYLTAAGATQLGTASDNYAPCTDNGQTCKDDIFAVSLAGQTPASRITWFQANVACANSGKRLPSNAEWQMAATGSPDPGGDNGTTDCNSLTGSVSLTGARSSCVSAYAAFDMVGNLYEWVADWVPRSTTCGTWGAGISPTDDYQCLAGAETTGEPGALMRGGRYSGGFVAGPLNVTAQESPSFSSAWAGFRCAR